MSNSMTKWILALCISASAVMGCGMDPAEEEAEAAAVGGAGGAGGAAGDATEDLEVQQGALIRYIDYGALRGNRAPCPPNQVMDTYTHRCVPRPPSIYRRGCYAVTRCARG